MLAASPGERLRTLRELLGITQEQLASMSGMGQSWISQVETSARDATDDGLRAIAAATDAPLGFFAVQPSTVPLDSLRFRKRASASKMTTRRVQAFFAESYRVDEELVAHERYPTPVLPYATDDDLDLDSIDELAEQARQALRLAPDKPIPHLTRALERGGVAVAPLLFSDHHDDDAATSGHDGVSFWGGVGDPALIGYFPADQGDRERFTLAHELGHLVLHTFRPRATNPEREANLFAGALLLPRERAREGITTDNTVHDYARLKATWGMSMQALIQRGHALDLIGDTRRRSLFVQLSSKGWRTREPVHVGREAPLLLWRMLSARFGSKPYRRAAEALAVPPTVLRSIAPTPDSRGKPDSDVNQDRSTATIHKLVR